MIVDAGYSDSTRLIQEAGERGGGDVIIRGGGGGKAEDSIRVRDDFDFS
jgi:hypothetical protein